MGSSQSVPSTSEITYSPSHASNVKEYKASTKNGPKTQPMEQTNPISNTAENEGSIADSDSSVVTTESDYSSDEEEDFDFDSNEEYEAERRLILEEASKLREMAAFYMHPEAPLASDATACARCYFTRYSAPASEELEDEEERKRILADAQNLKELAGFYMHPEKPVVSNDATACGRNYFSRPSAPEYDEEDVEERERILEEMKQLKTTAEWYMHPEKPVAVDATACGRNYFTRASAPVTEHEDERQLILEDMKQLKTTAEWYMHPEKPVAVDATACGRNYFTRASAPVTEHEDERQLILEEMKQLKITTEWYMHPEKPVAVDSTACGRNYFTRPSAPEYEDDDELEEERERILEEMKQLKTTAEWYMHPEKPVTVDSTACGRNYFTRPSAPIETEEMADERERILEEMKQLKTTAEWYMHPEKPVAVDSTACGRNYFSRPSAQTNEEEEERERILDEMKQLKTTAEWYMHPEKPVSVDSAACGRNYFTRPSAPIETEEMADERERILEEMKQLKTTAEWYMHPEKPVTVDSTACGRNYFTRPSAPEYEDEDMDDERERILDEMKQLKTTAEWYMHPEKPVTVDPTACGRNYFSRPSAIDDNAGAVSWETSDGLQVSLDFESNYSDEREEERKRVLAEASQLKEVASWYLEPEKPVKVDPAAFGRNYFTRPSAPEQEDDTEERDLILAELNELKKVADWYMHPEKPVTVYATACGRNFFNRPSAPEQEDEEVTKERDEVLAEAAELRRVAEWYMHPEKPVTVYATACGRNFFSRPSAPEYDEEMEEKRQHILAEAKELKEVASWYLNPEQPVKTDGLATARNFFTRPSAPEYDDEDLEEERERILAEAKELKEVASWYLQPEKPVTVHGAACGRNYFTRPSAPEYDDEERERILVEARKLKEVASWYLQPEKPVTVDGAACGRNYFTRPSAVQVTEEEERQRILADAMELKKLAVDYMHPENPVVSSSINCSRNYFDRPSAKGHADYIHTEGYANHSHIHGDYVHEGFHDHDYHYHDHYHHDDISHQSFQSQSDHFEMDEDGLHGFRESINAFRESVVGVHDPEHIPIIKEEGDGKEGNLSRSPSSIMLFDAQATI